LCSPVKNHDLPDRNKRVAFLCLVEFIERNGAELVVEDDGELIRMLVGIETGTVEKRSLSGSEHIFVPRLPRTTSQRLHLSR